MSEKNDPRVERVKEFTGIIRKAIDTKRFNDTGEVPPDEEGITETMQVFQSIAERVQGNKPTLSLSDPEDSYLIFEGIIRWCAEYLGIGEQQN